MKYVNVTITEERKPWLQQEQCKRGIIHLSVSARNKNKRPMGHIANLRNLGPFRNIFPISNMHFISICPIRPSGANFQPSCLCSKSESFHVNFSFSGFIVLKEKIFKWPHPILTFLWLYPLWKGPGPLIEQTWFPSPKDNLFKVWFWPTGSREDFYKFSMYFHSFAITSPWLGPIPFIWTNLNPFSIPKDDLCQVWLKLAQWFWRKRFLKDPTLFLHLCDYLQFEEDMALYLNKLEFPLPKDNLYQVWLILASWFWRRRFFKIFSVFLLV
jgi:hypothetical protein